MPTGGDEAAWAWAKRQVSKQYPKVKSGGDKYWKLVQTLYQSKSEKAEKAVCEIEVPLRKTTKTRTSVRATPEQGGENVKTGTLVWEPPGGTHPHSWRAQVGSHKYIYSSAKPGGKGKKREDTGTEGPSRRRQKPDSTPGSSKTRVQSRAEPSPKAKRKAAKEVVRKLKTKHQTKYSIDRGAKDKVKNGAKRKARPKDQQNSAREDLRSKNTPKDND